MHRQGNPCLGTKMACDHWAESSRGGSAETGEGFVGSCNFGASEQGAFWNAGGDVRELDFQFNVGDKKIGAPFHGLKAFFTTPQLSLLDKVCCNYGATMFFHSRPLIENRFTASQSLTSQSLHMSISCSCHASPPQPNQIRSLSPHCFLVI